MKKKVLYVERGIDEYGLYEGTQDAMKDLNVELSITLDPKDIEDCDGVIFPGGLPDVDPELYGEENQGSMNLDRTLDDEQMAMIDAAVKAKKPILAICRGMQLVNVYFGGTLIQDLENGTMHKYVPNENKLHDTVCISGTPFAIIYGDTGIVNSAHHQAVKKLGKGFKIGQVWLSGKLSPEQKKEWLEKIENDENLEIECKRTCIIEGMIHKELPIIMVQWHPELMHRDPIKGTLDQDVLCVITEITGGRSYGNLQCNHGIYELDVDIPDPCPADRRRSCNHRGMRFCPDQTFWLHAEGNIR